MPDDEGLREDERVLAEILHVMHNGWDGSEATRGWKEEDWRYNAEFYLPVVERYAAQRVAEALREAADLRRQLRNLTAERDELDRQLADALAADGTEPRPAHRQDETEAGR